MFPAPTRTIDVFVPHGYHAPPMRSLYTVLYTVYRHLERDEKNICVVTCQVRYDR